MVGWLEISTELFVESTHHGHEDLFVDRLVVVFVEGVCHSIYWASFLKDCIDPVGKSQQLDGGYGFVVVFLCSEVGVTALVEGGNLLEQALVLVLLCPLTELLLKVELGFYRLSACQSFGFALPLLPGVGHAGVLGGVLDAYCLVL